MIKGLRGTNHIKSPAQCSKGKNEKYSLFSLLISLVAVVVAAAMPGHGAVKK